MTMWQRPSAVSLLAAHLRSELERGRWQGKMPGVIRLARKLVPPILRWANNVAMDKDDLRQKITSADFVEGGTIGPVPRR